MLSVAFLYCYAECRIFVMLCLVSHFCIVMLSVAFLYCYAECCIFVMLCLVSHFCIVILSVVSPSQSSAAIDRRVSGKKRFFFFLGEHGRLLQSGRRRQRTTNPQNDSVRPGQHQGKHGVHLVGRHAIQHNDTQNNG
jgi:hypothetical protein